MVIDYWNFGLIATSVSVYCVSWYCIRYTKLATFTINYFDAMVWLAILLVSSTNYFFFFPLAHFKFLHATKNCVIHETITRFIHFFRYVLPESPRWLLAKGRIDELKRIIETAARWNKRVLPPGYEKSLLMPDGESSGSVFDLFKPEYLRTTLLLLVAWYALVLQYMAITLHIGEMGGNIYLITVIR